MGPPSHGIVCLNSLKKQELVANMIVRQGKVEVLGEALDCLSHMEYDNLLLFEHLKKHEFHIVVGVVDPRLSCFTLFFFNVLSLYSNLA